MGGGGGATPSPYPSSKIYHMNLGLSTLQVIAWSWAGMYLASTSSLRNLLGVTGNRRHRKPERECWRRWREKIKTKYSNLHPENYRIRGENENLRLWRKYFYWLDIPCQSLTKSVNVLHLRLTLGYSTRPSLKDALVEPYILQILRRKGNVYMGMWVHIL
jgi:hypothetical protein